MAPFWGRGLLPATSPPSAYPDRDVLDRPSASEVDEHVARNRWSAMRDRRVRDPMSNPHPDRLLCPRGIPQRDPRQGTRSVSDHCDSNPFEIFSNM